MLYHIWRVRCTAYYDAVAPPDPMKVIAPIWRHFEWTIEAEAKVVLDWHNWWTKRFNERLMPNKLQGLMKDIIKHSETLARFIQDDAGHPLGDFTSGVLGMSWRCKPRNGLADPWWYEVVTGQTTF